MIYRAVTAVEEGLTSAPASSLGFANKTAEVNQSPEKDEQGNEIYSESRAEIENGVHQLETLLQATVDKNFDKFEIYVLRNILSVPEEIAPWVQLGHYQNLDLNHVPAPNGAQSERAIPTPETLHLLRRKLTGTRKLHSILLAERARNATYIAQLHDLLTATDPLKPGLAFLTQSSVLRDLNTQSSAESVKTPLTNHTRNAIAQLPQLRQLLVGLRQKEEEGLKFSRHSVANEERREYIESQVRRRLEREGADLQTGEGLMGKAVQGRTVAGEDVRGIEGIVGLLGREKAGGADRMDES